MALAAVFKGWAVKLVIARDAPLALRQSVSVGLYGLLLRGVHPWRFGSLAALGYMAC